MKKMGSSAKELVALRIDKQLLQEIDTMTAPGTSRSDFIRTALADRLSCMTTRLVGETTPLQRDVWGEMSADFPNLSEILSAQELMGVAVIVKDLEHKIIYANPRAVSHLGAKSPADVQGKPEEEFYLPISTSNASQTAAVLAGGGTGQNTSTVEMHLSRDGRLELVRSIRMLWSKEGSGEPALHVLLIKRLSPGEQDEFFRQMAGAEEEIKSDGGVYLARISGGQGAFYFDEKIRASGVLSHRQLEEAGQMRWLHPATRSDRQRISLLLARGETATNVHAEDVRSVRDFLQHLFFAASVPKLLKVKFRLWQNDREFRWYQAAGFIFREAGGERQAVIAHSEINEGTQASNVARMLLDAFPGYLFIKDIDRRFVFMSERLLQEFGKTLKQICGKTDRDLGLASNEAEFFQRADDLVLKPNGPRWHFIPTETLTLPRRLPKELITLKMAVPASRLGFDAPPDARYILGISFEATDEWRRIEEAYSFWEAFLEHSDDVVYVKNAKSEYRQVSKAFCELVGVIDPATVIGKTAREVWRANPELVPKMEEADEVALREGKYVDGEPKKTITPEGRVQYRVTAKVRFEDRRRNRFLMGISRDVTKLVELCSAPGAEPAR